MKIFEESTRNFILTEIMSLGWVPKSNGDYVQSGGVHAGVDTGNELYVARAYHDGAIVPGKLHVTHSSVYIPYNMVEVSQCCFVHLNTSIKLSHILISDSRAKL